MAKKKTSTTYMTQYVLFKFQVSLFNGISTFVGYLMQKPSFKKNTTSTI